MADSKPAEAPAPAPTTFTLTGEVYLDAARAKVVDRDSGKAAVRLGGKGKVIPLARAKKLGLVKG